MSILKITLHLKLKPDFTLLMALPYFAQIECGKFFNHILIQDVVNNFRNEEIDRFLLSSILLYSQV